MGEYILPTDEPKTPKVTVCDVDLYLEDPLLGDPKFKELGIALGEALLNNGWPKKQ